MNKTVFLAILSYTVGTFFLAILWHIVLFEPQYMAFSYIEGEPNFLLGLSSILIQGIVLSCTYHYVRKSLHVTGLRFVAVMGIFFWTSHVLAFIAKQDVDGVVLFVAMETVYLVLQFGLYGCALRLLYGRK